MVKRRAAIFVSCAVNHETPVKRLRGCNGAEFPVKKTFFWCETFLQFKSTERYASLQLLELQIRPLTSAAALFMTHLYRSLLSSLMWSSHNALSQSISELVNQNSRGTQRRLKLNQRFLPSAGKLKLNTRKLGTIYNVSLSSHIQLPSP